MTFEARHEIVRESDTQVGSALFDSDQHTVFQDRDQTATYGFDFGQFRHDTAKLEQIAFRWNRLAITTERDLLYGPAMLDGNDDHATSFGDRQVGEEEKAGLVRDVFESVAPSYDLMNDLMSAGVHRLWKRRMVTSLRPRAGQHVVDVAGGTGDIAFRLIERGCRISLVDINPAMLSVGRDRAIDRGLIGDLAWICGDAEALPLADGSADAYTIAFGIRNVTHIERALSEARRVLKPGGQFACLEFSHVVLPVLDRLYNAYSDTVLPRLGAVIAGDEPSYRYLVESIRRFPDQQRFATMIDAAGFAHVRVANLTGGVAALHTAWRL
jgi:demethylmenaquinone methyltransferase/2-methoxy-6-polyprenyl-1,4-benzoquinol methylase